MATAESQSNRQSQMSGKRKAAYAVLAVCGLILLIILLSWNSIKSTAQVGTAYSAHIVCSCRYIEGRDMASCETDREDGMEIISLADDPENQRMYASVPFLAKAVAEKRGDFGCIVLNDAEMDALD